MVNAKEATPQRRRWIWLFVIGFTVLLGVSTLAPHLNPFRIIKERRWVGAAQAVVEDYLRNPPPGTVRDAVGGFKHLSGNGYHYPFWNINEAHLIAVRTAHFAEGAIPVRIYVWEPAEENTHVAWTVERAEKGPPPLEDLTLYVRMK